MADETKCARCAATDAHLSTIRDAQAKLTTDHEKLLTDHDKLMGDHKQLLGNHQSLAAQLKSFEDWAAEEAEEHSDGEENLTATLTATHGKTIPVTAMLTALAGQRKQLRAVRKELATLTGEKSSAAMLGKVTAWKDGAGELVTLKAELDKAQKATLAANFKTLTDKAVAEGKLPPVERDHYVKLTETKGVEYVMEFLSARLGATTAPLVNTTVTTPPSQETAMALATLSAGEQAELAKLFPNLSIEEAAKGKSTWQKSLPTVLAARADK